MCAKIKGVADFLPVVDVVASDELGFTWRTMTFNGPGPMHGQVIVEHIYADAAKREIRFVLTKEGVETDTEVINALLLKPMRIEYYQRAATTKERLLWMAPKSGTADAIEKTIAICSKS